MRHFILALRFAAAGLALVCSGLTPAKAVVIAYGDGSGNTTAPAGVPAWADMARVANASAVYLGNGWMITDQHVIGSVGGSPVTFTDGRVFNSVAGTDIQLTNSAALLAANPTMVPAADLKMFRLAADPGLPSLSIVTAAPSAATNVMMIGAGENREPNLIGWSVSSTFVWTQTPLPFANARGFAVDTSSSQMRWGTSQVAAGGTSITNNPNTGIPTTSTATFATNFNSAGNPYSAQAVHGDSGGGVFQFVNGSWQLAGLINSIGSVAANQPPATVSFGNNETIAADLSQYSAEIESILNQPAPPLVTSTALAKSLSEPPLWQNPGNPFDVARSGLVDARDVLLLINSLQNGKGGPLSGAPSASDLLVDVNGDGVFNVSDVLQVINALTSNTANPVATTTSLASSLGSSNLTAVPEPSTAILALLGVLLVGLARRRVIAFRGH